MCSTSKSSGSDSVKQSIGGNVCLTLGILALSILALWKRIASAKSNKCTCNEGSACSSQDSNRSVSARGVCTRALWADMFC